MLFYNSLPLSAHYEQWLEDGVPPDDYPWHDPHLQVKYNEFITLPVPDDLHERYLLLIQWIVNESAWDQLYRQPQVSHREYQHVVDYLLELEEEMEYEVPGELSGIGMDMPLNMCVWGANYKTYPDYIINRFKAAGMEQNVTSPIDDERDPCYNLFASMRLWKKSQPLKFNPRTGQARKEP